MKTLQILFFLWLLVLPNQGFAQEKSSVHTVEWSKKFPGGIIDSTTYADGSTYVAEINKDKTIWETTSTYPNGNKKYISKTKDNPDGTSDYDHVYFDQKGKLISSGKGKSEGHDNDLIITQQTEDSYTYDENGRTTQHVRIEVKDGEVNGLLETTTYRDDKDKTGTTTKKKIHWDKDENKWFDDFGIEVKDMDFKPSSAMTTKKKPTKAPETQPTGKPEKTSENLPQEISIPPWFVNIGHSAAGTQDMAVASGSGGSLDPCLVGSWRSEPVGENMLGVTGGGGILVTFKADGTQTIDYNGMQAFKGGYGDSNLWTGTAEGHITTREGKASVNSVERSDVVHKYEGPSGRRTNPLSGGLGPAGLGNNRFDPSYQCNETRLTYKDPGRTFVFLRLDRL